MEKESNLEKFKAERNCESRLVDTLDGGNVKEIEKMLNVISRALCFGSEHCDTLAELSEGLNDVLESHKRRASNSYKVYMGAGGTRVIIGTERGKWQVFLGGTASDEAKEIWEMIK